MQNMHGQYLRHNSVRSVDELFLAYTETSRSLYRMLLDSPQQVSEQLWQDGSPFTLDRTCSSPLEKEMERSKAVCTGCLLLRRIFDFSVSEIERPIIVPTGRYAGKKIIVQRNEIGHLYLQVANSGSQDHPAHKNAVSKVHNSACVSKAHNIPVLVDSFTLRVLSMTAVNQIFAEKGMPHSLHLWNAFVCAEKAYTVLEYPDVGTWDKLLRHDLFTTDQQGAALGVVTQLLAALSELARYNFSHGHPTGRSLLFTTTPVSYRYGSLLVQAPFTLKIANFWDSSFALGGRQYFSPTVEEMVFSSPFLKLPSLQGDRYLLTEQSQDSYLAFRQQGHLLYAGSFDFYSVLLSLLCTPVFYKSFMDNQHLLLFWSEMWEPADRASVEERILQAHSTASSPSFLELAKDLRVRCDILPVLCAVQEREEGPKL